MNMKARLCTGPSKLHTKFYRLFSLLSFINLVFIPFLLTAQKINIEANSK